MLERFKRKPKEGTSEIDSPKTGPKWFKVSLILNISLVIVAVIAGSGMAIIHESDTNPNFCGVCHIMQPRVESYMTGNTLDSVHAKANVQCKDCHDYPVPAEIESGIKYITGNYDSELRKRQYDDDMCTDCHISMDYMAQQTDYLTRNPHLSHWPGMNCTLCHVSHGEQVDYCGQCHDNGNQRLTGGPIIPRAENPWAPAQ